MMKIRAINSNIIGRVGSIRGLTTINKSTTTNDFVWKMTVRPLASSSSPSSVLCRYQGEQHKPLPRQLFQQHLRRTLSARSSSSASVLSSDSDDESDRQHHNDKGHGSVNPVPDLTDIQAAYNEPKTTYELARAAICFQACQYPWIVQNSRKLFNVASTILPQFVVNSALKATFYGQFCAGEDAERIRPVIQKLKKYGIGSILDYAAEDDGEGDDDKNLNGGGGASNNANVNTNTETVAEDTPTMDFIDDSIVAKTYDYESEAKCDQHVETFLHCIRDVASSSKSSDGDVDADGGYAAIKVTALGNPKLLARLSTAITEAKRLFETFDLNQDGVISRDEFEESYRLFFTVEDDEEGKKMIRSILDEFDPDNTGQIDYITWSMMLGPKDLPRLVSKCRSRGRLAEATPTDEELELLTAMFNRGRRLGEEAAKTGTRLLIDAEQVRFQPAIDNLVFELQRTFNATDKADRPVIYNTYQCYLKDSPDRLRLDVERSERYGFHFGAKLVRGAYMESERELATNLGLPDPIHDTIEDTHACYDDSVAYLLDHSTQTDKCLELMCATHNQASIENAIEAMNRLGVDRNNSTICFAQLLGMADHLSFNLGKCGYRIFKYVPYGEVHETMEYLLRRVQENSA
eukprot:CAMPEP_0113484784 /NCGR_PEP_ID=MMETSP0014_2-20120614/24145_1 /TAXON_ID=2857 /ORGANISM="Nitzschia sp." /LENGTH=633 /DNA_ID=CAMNT_0000378407 /DNA_START=243 /DNA_END=2141 /DNA_ORIENTATION=- /assembly_acc=CAM_ASM_000159